MTVVLVVGFGVTGRAVAQALMGDGERVVAVDDCPGPEAVAAAADLGVRLLPRPSTATLDALLADTALVVPSPGVPVGHPVVAVAAACSVPVISEIELAWRRLAARGPGGPRLVAVTGTNGKTTVVTLVADILAASGQQALAAGNIGHPLIDAVGRDVDVVVGEVSSFQLQFTEDFRPAVCCWLNTAENHLDWHPSMAHYAAAKARIWAAQGPGDVAVVNLEDPIVMAAASAPHGIPAGVVRRDFSTSGPADFMIDRERGVLLGPDGDIAPVSALPRALPHDLANALAAAAVADAAGATRSGRRAGLEGFEGLPHRVQRVATAGGVGWYDDSKATTPASVLAAVAGFSSVVLIAGGRNKGLDLAGLAAAAPPVRAVVAIGDAASEVQAAFSGVVPVEAAPTMAAAVAAAARLARPGDTVLLSPGCASFDWYRSYAERGDDFAALVARQLGDEGGAG
jgi:UDP-N-acetylmuramoylalanine--D-glutamate ligase